jgi:hypothetical protein
MGKSIPSEEIPETLVLLCMYCGRSLNGEGSLGRPYKTYDTFFEESRVYYGKCQECLKEHSPSLYSCLYEERKYSSTEGHFTLLH